MAIVNSFFILAVHKRICRNLKRRSTTAKDVYSKQGYKLAFTQQETAFWRDQLDREKEKLPGREKFPSDVNRELDALEKELTGYGYDPDFSVDILRQIAESLVRRDGNDQLRLRFARSIIKGVKSGDQMEMLLVVQMISGHVATMALTALMHASKDPDLINSYGNMSNKFARTYVHQLGALHRCRSGPEPKLMVNNVSVNDGGQAAFVGHHSQSGVDKDKAIGTKSPLLVADQSGMAMPIVEQDNQRPAPVPRMDQDQQPAPSAAKRKRRP
jgi:hypothetical protein